MVCGFYVISYVVVLNMYSYIFHILYNKYFIYMWNSFIHKTWNTDGSIKVLLFQFKIQRNLYICYD